MCRDPADRAADVRHAAVGQPDLPNRCAERPGEQAPHDFSFDERCEHRAVRRRPEQREHSDHCVEQGSFRDGDAERRRSLAKELSARGIRVNSVAPGSTRTRIAHDAFEHHPEVIPDLVAQTALGRLGEADDIGKVIAALLSENSAG
jgi:hypothetical protein